MNAVGALREDEALRQLRDRLQVPPSDASCNSYLLRFLRAAQLDVESAVRKIQDRRQCEETMAAIYTSSHAVNSLQSGAFASIGEDVFHRPILYIRVKEYHHSGDSTSETRLAMLVLEFLWTLVESRNVEQCIILLNETDAGFWAGRDSPMQERLATVIQRYYPGLIGAILVVNSSWGTKRILRLHAATGTTPTEVRQLVQFVASKDLTSLMAPNVIPREFGGTNNVAVTCPPEDLADRVLRHWFALSTALRADADAGEPGRGARPLYKPLNRQLLNESAVTSAAVAARRQAAAGSGGSVLPAAAGGGGTASASSAAGSRRPASAHGDRYVDPNGTMARLQTARGARHTPRYGNGAASIEDIYSDDGRCSAISDSDLFTAEEDAYSAREGSVRGSEPLPRRETSFEGDDAPMDPLELKERLRLEVERRRRLEVAIDDLRLGTAYRDGDEREKPIEAALREHHDHVNALVAQVITASRGAKPPKTLKQLLVETDRAILGAIPDQQTTPCMSGAVPVDRKPKSSCVVC